MIKAAVLGSPIAHSLSPKIHTKAFETLGIDGEYQAIQIDEAGFPEFFEKNRDADWRGFSLTMPLKETVLKVCDDVDENAMRINSANTLYRFGADWKVTSTDYFAFQNLLNVTENMKVAVIGGGGTARAAIGALNSKIASVDVFLRNPDRLQAMSDAAPDVLVNQLDMNSPMEPYDLIIQTTPAGAFDLHAVNLKSTQGALLECLYKPWPTPLASRFLELGGVIISGKELLVEQALFQIQLFTEVDFDMDHMRQVLSAHIATD